MISVDEALKLVLDLAAPLPTERVPLAQAAGRSMATGAQARRDQPPFDASAMDGYAVAVLPQVGDVLRLVGKSQAGRRFAGHLQAGEAIRISTGAPVPESASHVIIQEHTVRNGDRITITEASAKDNIRRRGQDFRAGQAFGPRRLRPADLGLLAAMDVAEVEVFRRPVVAILSTGDELAMPGTPMRDDQIPSANAFSLMALVEAEGGVGRILPIARDDRDSLRATFALAEGADLVVTIGGASVGDHDLVGAVAAELGLDLSFHKIAMRPGKPLMAGRLRDMPMLGLPGNPVSAYVCAHLFLLPMLRAMTGQTPEAASRTAVLDGPVPANGPRAHYMRARVRDGVLTPFAEQDSSLLLRLTEANALLIRPVDDPARDKGAVVDYLPL
ncbi:molybdopterin molybdotransferase MoeA [Falsirhodobacter sp. 20TX0035]|uniref:molybdopterin molybdotransferase MoeA n=1 Tax=Falsirhodobacter sp. 20TX0035 TaxID=3022019 RepID=UPI00232C7C0B|nr:molybdopterin molybdotransferase MoeA [Falsirhodobacter sp. 20TX0035]MDB6454435.1 molybdopterin molybdotransferase MoeA [Falsirhodobacter sp. 20TX0035]